VADVREELLATLTALADFSYGWGLLDTHLPRLQAAVSTPHSAAHQVIGCRLKTLNLVNRLGFRLKVVT